MQKNKHLINFIISIFLTATFFGILNTTQFFNVTLVIKLGLTASILLKSFIYYLTLFFYSIYFS
jgi:heme/copper-type cytochrome/quinol oxidase subunit 4